MKNTILPMTDLQFRPAFWGFDRDLKDVMDRLENVWEGEGSMAQLHETEKAFVYMLDMPGVSKKDIDLQVEGDFVTINGRRSLPFGGEGKTVSVARSVRVPKNVNREKIQAHCVDGVLYLAFPKEEKARPKKIKISEADEGAWNNLIGVNETDKKNKAKVS